MQAANLMLDEAARKELWLDLIAAIEHYTSHVDEGRVTPELNPGKIRSLLQPLDFNTPLGAREALAFAAENLSRYQVHTAHRRYFGLFNPAPTTMGIAADALVATFNPQLAAWSHSPFAAEVEQHLVRAFGLRFGYRAGQIDGAFASGGAEANHTAMLTALTHAFPELGTKGVRSIAAQPVFYASTESHHSLVKAAKLCGIGADAVRFVPIDGHLRLDAEALDRQIARDRAEGVLPFLVVATAGTTNAGVVDDISAISSIAARENLWLHVDAAWGGAAVLVPELRLLLAGIERADSITFDAHKWLSVQMGAGLYLTRHTDIMDRTFRTQTAYMPREAAGLDVVDPHLHTMQWSRRFIGLKVFLSLLVAGWQGYEEAIRHQTGMGKLLRTELEKSDWQVVNETALPVVCFMDPKMPDACEAIALEIVSSGKSWISTTQVGGRTVLRACITNHRTQPEDVRALVADLNAVRERRSLSLSELL